MLAACTRVRIDEGRDAALAQAVEKHQLFAKLAPLHKERIVRALRANGHVVGFKGGGINDAPALRAADIGISVDSGVDIAKEAADIILLEKSLMVLDDGVIEGRTTFCNMLKYIHMPASSNFGNVLSVLVASAFLPFLPMQLLVQNLFVGLLTQTLIVHMIRSPKLPFIESRAAAPLLAMTATIMVIGIWLPMGSLAEYFKLQPLPPTYFIWLVGILVGYSLLTTVMKRFYIRRFGWQ